MTVLAQRARFIALAVNCVGAPYLWGSKGAKHAGVQAFDCSGLVTWCLLRSGGPDWTRSHNTDTLLAKLAPVLTPRPGTLVLYGAGNDAQHVMVHLGDGVVVGASGGGPSTTSLAMAAQHEARVKAFPWPDYRPDRLGFRELPFADEAAA